MGKKQPVFLPVKNSEIFIGVDPGTTGAIAFLGVEAGKIERVSIIDYADPNVKDYLRAVSDRAAFGLSSVSAIVEEVGMRPGQDVIRTSKYVVHHGIIQGWLQMLSIGYKLVNPRTWQAKIYRSIGADQPASNYNDVKPRHLAIARAAYAAWPDVLAAIARCKDHNRADALLIAHYGFLLAR
jgi:hypothetical protein